MGDVLMSILSTLAGALEGAPNGQLPQGGDLGSALASAAQRLLHR